MQEDERREGEQRQDEAEAFRESLGFKAEGWPTLRCLSQNVLVFMLMAMSHAYHHIDMLSCTFLQLYIHGQVSSNNPDQILHQQSIVFTAIWEEAVRRRPERVR